MKTKNLFSWRILTMSLGCFLFISHSSHGMFGEELGPKKAAEEAKLKAEQEADQRQREKALTDLSNESDSQSSTLGRTTLSAGSAPSERSPEEAQEIADRLEVCELATLFSGQPPLTEEERTRLVAEIVADIDSRKTEAGRLKAQQDADQRERERERTLSRTTLSASSGPSERPPEKVQEIGNRLEEYENLLKADESSPVTEQERKLFILQVAAEIDTRKATPSSQQQATTTDLSSSKNPSSVEEIVANRLQELEKEFSQDQTNIDGKKATPTQLSPTPTITSPAPLKAAESILKTAAVKAAATPAPSSLALQQASPIEQLPVPPPQPSTEFLRQKNSSLQNLQQQIDAARAELGTHQTERDKLRAHFDKHTNYVAWCQQQVDNFKAENLVYTFSSRLKELRAARDAATLAKTKFINDTSHRLTTAENSIKTLTSRINALVQDHTHVTDSEDPLVVEYRRQQERERQEQEARFAEQRRQQAALAKAKALEERKKKEAEEVRLAAERIKAAASREVTAPATVKVAAQPLQGSEFEREKNSSLQHLEDQILVARNELATHAATKRRLERLTETSHELEFVKSSIKTLNSNIRSLEQERTRVAASEDPAIVRQRQKDQAAVREKQQQEEAKRLADQAADLDQQRQKAAIKVAPAVTPLPPQQASAIKQLPVKPPEPSVEFLRKKAADLKRIENEIAIATEDRDRNEATRDTLQHQLDEHIQNVKAANKAVDQFERDHPVRMFTSLLKPSQRLNQLCDTRIKAVQNKNQFVRENMAALEGAKGAIWKLNSRIRSLGDEYDRVAASEDPLVTEYHRQQKAMQRAVANEERRQREAEEGRIAGLAQRKEIEAQLAAKRAAALRLQEITNKRSSLGSTSSESENSHNNSSSFNSSPESQQSTPEKVTPLSAAASLEAERLQRQIDEVHQAVGKAREAVRAVLKAYNYESFVKTWRDYFNLAEQRSLLKQRLAILTMRTPEPVFKRSVEETLFSEFRKTLSEENFYNDLTSSGFLEDLSKLYNSHGATIYRMHEDHYDKRFRGLKYEDINIAAYIDDYIRSHADDLEELERPLMQRVQKRRKNFAIKLLQAELALLAPEEHPALLNEIEQCVWQNMPGFSEEDRSNAMSSAKGKYFNAALDRFLREKYPMAHSYSIEKAAAEWWINKGQSEALARQYLGRQNLAKYYY